MEKIIAPSVLSLDYSQMEHQIEQLNQSTAKWLHFDVMDGHFVPNLTFGPDILKGFDKVMNCFMDVHVMIEDPYYFAPIFIDAGADQVTFHYEVYKDQPEKINEVIDLIHSKGAKAGLSIKPDTDVNVLKPFYEKLDTVLIMSVYPGFGGQSFIEESVDRCIAIKKEIEQHHYSCLIEMDGGINANTIEKASKAGCDVFVAGSAVFKGNIIENVDNLWKKASL